MDGMNGEAAPGAAVQSLYVHAEPDVAEAMRLTRHAAQRAGFSSIDVSYLATVATELASNLWIHAGGGVYSVQVDTALPGIEIQTTDNGPGIPDVAQALRDGYSTAGGLGCGLGGVKRLMDGLEIKSAPGGGTSVRAWKVCRHVR
jgi:serine/threonine-protein kinase RsbT